MTDQYSTPPAPQTGSDPLTPGQLPNTDPGVDLPSKTQSAAYCPFCFYSQWTQNNYTCHRNAPMPQAGAINWPTVQATDWCGEFRQR